MLTAIPRILSQSLSQMKTLGLQNLVALGPTPEKKTPSVVHHPLNALQVKEQDHQVLTIGDLHLNLINIDILPLGDILHLQELDMIIPAIVMSIIIDMKGKPHHHQKIFTIIVDMETTTILHVKCMEIIEIVDIYQETDIHPMNRIIEMNIEKEGGVMDIVEGDEGVATISIFLIVEISTMKSITLIIIREAIMNMKVLENICLLGLEVAIEAQTKEIELRNPLAGNLLKTLWLRVQQNHAGEKSQTAETVLQA